MLSVGSKLFESCRRYWRLRFVLSVFAALVVHGAEASLEADRSLSPVDSVRPWIGSDNGRWFQVVSAGRPFGLVGIVPDTEIKQRWGNSGYVYAKTNVFGFAHLHGWGLAAILVMPTLDGIDPAQGPEGWASGFQHAHEIMSAGYHKVLLDRYGITTEITSTARAGFHRWTFARAGEAEIVFDLGSRLPEADQTDAQVTRVSDTELEGWVHLHAGYEGESDDVGKVFFVARFSKPFDSLNGWQGRELGSVSSARGHPLIVWPRFPVRRGEVLTMKIGLSFCNASEARKNLDIEIGNRSFQTIRNESRAEWNRWLNRVWSSPAEPRPSGLSSTPTCGTRCSVGRP